LVWALYKLQDGDLQIATDGVDDGLSSGLPMFAGAFL
jgi:hypothetical protein